MILVVFFLAFLGIVEVSKHHVGNKSYLDHDFKYSQLQCEDTTVTTLCFRNCSLSTLNVYKDVAAIKSPTANETLRDYELKQLKVVADAGKQFAFALEKTPIFTLIKTIVKEKWFQPLNKANLMKLIEAELVWFIVIAFFLLMVTFLSVFVTFSILDGIFGWTDSTKIQKMSPSNSTWVNVYGILIMLVTITVLIGCVFCWVGNLLVTENKSQSQAQLNMDFEWSMSYSLQGRGQLQTFLNEFNTVLLPKTKELYYEATPKGVELIWKNTREKMVKFVEIAAGLQSNLDASQSVDEYTTLINKSVILTQHIASIAAECDHYIPLMKTQYCAVLALPDCWKRSKKVNVSEPDLSIFTTYPDVSKISVDELDDISTKVQKAISLKIQEDVQNGYNRYNGLKTLMEKRSGTARSDYQLQLDQTIITSTALFDVFVKQQDEGFRSFKKAIQYPKFFFSDSSPLSTYNSIRSYIFIVINVIAVLTVVVGTAAWCVGCCNFNENQIPTTRGAKSHFSGVVIYYSSYVALFLSLFTIVAGVVYFIPTSLFAFVCDNYNKSDVYMKAENKTGLEKNNFFTFWDDYVFTDHNILGLAIHDDKEFNLTFEYFFSQCYRDESLYHALKLNAKWNLLRILALNATLNIEYHVEQLKKVTFNDQTIMTNTTAEFTAELATSIANFNMKNITTKLNKTAELFKGYDKRSLAAWMFNLYLWNIQLKLKLPALLYPNRLLFTSKCYNPVMTTNSTIASMFKSSKKKKSDDDDDDDDDKKGSKSRKKRDDDDDDDDDDDEDDKDEDDFLNVGLAYYHSKFAETMVDVAIDEAKLDTSLPAVKSSSNDLYSRYEELEPLILVTSGPEWYKEVLTNYTGYIFTEIDCFIIYAAKMIEYHAGQCRTVYDVLHGTMLYFCNFLVGPMTVTWLSFLVIGISLTIYIQVARALSMYFLKMDKIHPDDISQEEKMSSLMN